MGPGADKTARAVGTMSILCKAIDSSKRAHLDTKGDLVGAIATQGSFCFRSPFALAYRAGLRVCSGDRRATSRPSLLRGPGGSI